MKKYFLPILVLLVIGIFAGLPKTTKADCTAPSCIECGDSLLYSSSIFSDYCQYTGPTPYVCPNPNYPPANTAAICNYHNLGTAGLCIYGGSYEGEEQYTSSGACVNPNVVTCTGTDGNNYSVGQTQPCTGPASSPNACGDTATGTPGTETCDNNSGTGQWGDCSSTTPPNPPPIDATYTGCGSTATCVGVDCGNSSCTSPPPAPVISGTAGYNSINPSDPGPYVGSGQFLIIYGSGFANSGNTVSLTNSNETAATTISYQSPTQINVSLASLTNADAGLYTLSVGNGNNTCSPATENNVAIYPNPTTAHASIEFSTASMTFSGTTGGSTPAPQNFTLTNNGDSGSKLVWQATTDANWCAVNGGSNGGYSSGTDLKKGDNYNMSVTVSSPTIPGTRTCHVTVSDDGSPASVSNTPQQLTLTYKVQCTSNAQCGILHICSSGACVSGCSSNSDCSSGQVCSSGACVSGCSSNSDCSGTQVCTSGTCTNVCSSDSDCNTTNACATYTCYNGGTSSSSCSLATYITPTLSVSPTSFAPGNSAVASSTNITSPVYSSSNTSVASVSGPSGSTVTGVSAGSANISVSGSVGTYCSLPSSVGVTVSSGPPAPSIAVSPLSFNFSSATGTPPANQNLTITETSGNASLNWSASTNQSWCTISPSSGTIAASGNHVEAISLSSQTTAGSYSCTVTITSNATNGTQTVPINYSVSGGACTTLTYHAATSGFSTSTSGPSGNSLSLSPGQTFYAYVDYSSFTDAIQPPNVSGNYTCTYQAFSGTVARFVCTAPSTGGSYTYTTGINSGTSSNDCASGPQNVGNTGGITVTGGSCTTLTYNAANSGFSTNSYTGPYYSVSNTLTLRPGETFWAYIDYGTTTDAIIPPKVTGYSSCLYDSYLTGTIIAKFRCTAPAPSGSYTFTTGINSGTSSNDCASGPQTIGNTNGITVTGGTFPSISLSAYTMTFSGVSSSTAPAAQTFTVTNNGVVSGANLKWHATTNSNWCFVNGVGNGTFFNGTDLAQGATSPSLSVTMAVPSNTGSPTCNVIISDNGSSPAADDSPQEIAVTYNVSPSDVSSVTLGLPPCPATGVVLNWTAAQSGSQPVSYNIYRNTTGSNPTAGDLLPASPVSGTSYTDSSASVAATYYYWVQAVSQGFNSPNKVASSPASITVGSCGAAPGPPTMPTASNSTCGSIVISWGPPSSGGVSNYSVSRSTSSPFASASDISGNLSNSTRSYTDSSAVPATVYYYWVLASNSSGFSATPIAGGSTSPNACSGNLSASQKDIVSINGSVIASPQCNGKDILPSDVNFNSGDTLGFEIFLCNSNTGTSSNISITDNMINLIKPSSGWNVKYNGSSLNPDASCPPSSNNHYCVSGTVPDQGMTINLSSAVIAPNGGGFLTYQADIGAPGYTGTLGRFQNAFSLTYNSGSGPGSGNVSANTPLWPFHICNIYISGSCPPSYKEIP